MQVEGVQPNSNGQLNGHFNGQPNGSGGEAHSADSSVPPPPAQQGVVLQGKRLLIATPCHSGDQWHEFTISLAKTQMALLQHGVEVMLMFLPGESVIQKARNALATRFLKTPCSHLLFIDADMAWEPDAVLRLLAGDKDISGVAGRRKCEPPSYCTLMDPSKNISDGMGMLKVHSVGTGFMMIKREVLEKIVLSEPENYYIDYGSGERIHNIFETRVHKFHFWSEDYIICLKWQNLGGDVWVDPHSRLKHRGEQVFEGAFIEEIQRFGKNFINHGVVGSVSDILGTVKRDLKNEAIPSKPDGGGHIVSGGSTDFDHYRGGSIPDPKFEQPGL